MLSITLYSGHWQLSFSRFPLVLLQNVRSNAPGISLQFQMKTRESMKILFLWSGEHVMMTEMGGAATATLHISALGSDKFLVD